MFDWFLAGCTLCKQKPDIFRCNYILFVRISIYSIYNLYKHIYSLFRCIHSSRDRLGSVIVAEIQIIFGTVYTVYCIAFRKFTIIATMGDILVHLLQNFKYDEPQIHESFRIRERKYSCQRFRSAQSYTGSVSSNLIEQLYIPATSVERYTHSYFLSMGKQEYM